MVLPIGRPSTLSESIRTGCDKIRAETKSAYFCKGLRVGDEMIGGRAISGSESSKWSLIWCGFMVRCSTSAAMTAHALAMSLKALRIPEFLESDAERLASDSNLR